jgi:hypothetical protein
MVVKPESAIGAKGAIQTMKLDRTFSREVSKIANGDGSREARFAFKAKVEEAKRRLSTPKVREIFGDCIKEFGRVPVAICAAVTIYERRDRLEYKTVCWAMEVLKLWTNCRFQNLLFAYIDDGLHPTRIEEYAWELMKLTTQEQ